MKKKAPITSFQLWKDNKLAGEWTISVPDAAAKFYASPIWQNYLSGWPFDRALAAFISANESDGGLQSANEVKEFPVISDAIFRHIYDNPGIYKFTH